VSDQLKTVYEGIEFSQENKVSDQPKTVYEGIEVVYQESDNTWGFTINNRDKTTKTLREAKELIDAALKAAEKKTFKRVMAYSIRRYGFEGGDVERGMVTSVATEGYRGVPMVWFTNDKTGRREKKCAEHIFEQSTSNDKLVEQYIALNAQLRIVRDNLDRLRNQMVSMEAKARE
jgi:hypothetical protein